MVYVIHFCLLRAGGNDYRGGITIWRELVEAWAVQHPSSALLDSSFRWNDEGVLFGFFLIHSLSRHFGLPATARLDDGCLAPRPVVIPAKARLHGCRW